MIQSFIVLIQQKLISWSQWVSFSGWWGEKEGSVLHSCSETRVVRGPALSSCTTWDNPRLPLQGNGDWRRLRGFHCLGPGVTCITHGHVSMARISHGVPNSCKEAENAVFHVSARAELVAGTDSSCVSFHLCYFLSACYILATLLGTEDVAVNRRHKTHLPPYDGLGRHILFIYFSCPLPYFNR